MRDLRAREACGRGDDLQMRNTPGGEVDQIFARTAQALATEPPTSPPSPPLG